MGKKGLKPCSASANTYYSNFRQSALCVDALTLRSAFAKPHTARLLLDDKLLAPREKLAKTI